MNKQFISTIFILLLVINNVQSKHWWLQGNSKIINKEEFQNSVGQGEYHYAISFFTPWCIYCQHMAGDWSRLADFFDEQNEKAENEDDKVKIVKLNCEDEQQFCQQRNIYSFPTIQFFSKFPSNPNKPEQIKMASDFRGMRKYDDFRTWVKTSVQHNNKKQEEQQEQKQKLEVKEQERQEYIEQQKKQEEQQKQQQQEQKSAQIEIESAEQQKLSNEQIKDIQDDIGKQQQDMEEIEQKQQEHIKEIQKDIDEVIQNQENIKEDDQNVENIIKAEKEQFEKLKQELEESQKREIEEKKKSQYLEQKLGELYLEVNELKAELHEFRLLEYKQSHQTLTTLNDYLFEETQQQKILYQTHQTIKMLGEKLLDENNNSSKAQQQEQKKQENDNNKQKQEEKQPEQNSEDKKSEGQDQQQAKKKKGSNISNELFVFGMTGIFLGFLMGILTNKKGKGKKSKLYSKSQSKNTEHELPLHVSDVDKQKEQLY